MKIRNGTIVIDLRKSNEQLWSEVDKKNRWSVNKAEKECVAFREGSEKDFDSCYNLYLGVCRTNLLIPENKHNVLMGKLFVAEKVGKIIAFSTVKEEENKAILSHNASDYEYRETQANSLLYWKTIMHYKEHGYKEFQLGGVDLHAKYRQGNDTFKIRWGGKLAEKSHRASPLEYVWWKWLRHVEFLRALKYRIQMLFHR